MIKIILLGLLGIFTGVAVYEDAVIFSIWWIGDFYWWRDSFPLYLGDLKRLLLHIAWFIFFVFYMTKLYREAEK